jgi:hypothetical protein
MHSPSRDELIAIVTRLLTADGTEQELDDMETWLEQHVPDPNVSRLIYHPEREMTAEEIVDQALRYQPTPLGGGA